MQSVTLGFAMCGSFCTFQAVLAQLEILHGEYPNIIPIMSTVSYETDSRFGTAQSFRERLEAICGHEILHTIPQVEPVGPKKLLDALVVAPCTGSTIAKLACGAADTPVTLACKAHLRNESPIVLAVSTNDGLAANAENIGKLLNRRHYYFVPFRQDAPQKKPRSLVADFSLIGETVRLALEGKQLQPILL
jgi:dipicolinate synthase subunit B